MQRRIFSGIQPTGVPHLGNYLGALRQWVDLQQDNSAQIIYSLVDLHAITIKYDPADLRRNCRESAAALLACGVDPQKCALFRQSAVSYHSELQWILTCVTPMGWLRRMTQFKQKAQLEGKNKNKNVDKALTGLFAYPVLQAADILLYQAQEVPVGEDQRQHLELAREIAATFNANFCKEYGHPPLFPLPKTIIPDQTSGGVIRVMSLRDGTKKMSKSDPVDASKILLTDTTDQIRSKIRKAKTDNGEQPLDYDVENRPERSNLLNLFVATDPDKRSMETLIEDYKNVDTLTFKNDLADAIIHLLAPIQQEYVRLRNDEKYIDKVLCDGAVKATNIASVTMQEVRKLTGLDGTGTTY